MQRLSPTLFPRSVILYVWPEQGNSPWLLTIMAGGGLHSLSVDHRQGTGAELVMYRCYLNRNSQVYEERTEACRDESTGCTELWTWGLDPDRLRQNPNLLPTACLGLSTEELK